jgi:hypothetical protein
MNVIHLLLLRLFGSVSLLVAQPNKWRDSRLPSQSRLRSALFWVITHRTVVIPYWLLGQLICTIKGQKILKMGPICCPETSVGNYHRTLRNIPEQRRSQVTLWYQNPVIRCRQYKFHRKFQCIFKKPCRLVHVLGLLDSGSEGTTILWYIGNYLPARAWKRPECLICHNVVPRISNEFVKF